MREIVLIAHNLRSSHNVGSLLRTAEGLGIKTVFLTGYTPYPLSSNDTRLPHIAAKTDKQIHKTALGAEHSQHWVYEEDVQRIIQQLREDRFLICALEQTKDSEALDTFVPLEKIAVIIGNEVSGLDASTLQSSDIRLEIPMFGKKESFNVAQAAAMCLYHISYHQLA